MRRQKQRYLHEPENFQYGDCHRTAIACLLDLRVWEAPHFIGEWEKRDALKKLEVIPDQFREEYDAATLAMDYSWSEEQEKWLNSIGYTTVDIIFGDGGEDKDLSKLHGLLRFMGDSNPNAYYMLGGCSPRGTNHSVICCGDGFEWDPHPEGGFLIGPMDHGYYVVTFILPLSQKRGVGA